VEILERFKKAIADNDDKEINIICHVVMSKGEELEDQGLTDSELDHLVGSCTRTDFPNFDNDLKSPYLTDV